MIRPRSLTAEDIEKIVSRLDAGQAVRRSLPVWGRLHVDRQLPFLVVYRRPLAGSDNGTDRLVLGGASFMQASVGPGRQRETSLLVEALATRMSEVFGAFLIVEVWSATGGETPPGELPEPRYRLTHAPDGSLDATVAEIAAVLAGSRVGSQQSQVAIETRSRISPPGTRPVLSAARLARCGASLVGLEVAPVYRAPNGDVYPALIRQSARRVTNALDRGFYCFTHSCTTARPKNYHQLGRRATVKAVFDVDARLADVASRFDVLLQVTPVNTEQAFARFKRSRFERSPEFHYRPLPLDPGRLKQRLWSVRPERVEDPTLMHLFRDAQFRLDREISLLLDIGRGEFVHESLQLYGGVEAELLELAEHILVSAPRRRTSRRTLLSADEFRGLAAAEVLSYRTNDPDFGSLPQVRDDIYAGLLVVRGRLLIGSETRIAAARADALIQHEVGTHMVTYHNGMAQPLKLLSGGLPGHDELQEGLAVFGEYLAGGLDCERMRVLAARVVAVHALVDGAEFVEAYRMVREFGFTQRMAFTITARVYRGGGFTKDASYLRGLSGILDYIAEGRELGRLFLGKYATGQLPVMEELLERKVLVEPRVLPKYLQRDDARERLLRAQRGTSVRELIER